MITTLIVLMVLMVVAGGAEFRKIHGRLDYLQSELDRRIDVLANRQRRADRISSDTPTPTAEPVAAAVEDEGPRWDLGLRCPCCTFLGQFDDLDLYICSATSPSSLISRSNGLGSAFFIASDKAAPSPPMVEAHRRAVARGLIPADTGGQPS
jgi:hypothetical protein